MKDNYIEKKSKSYVKLIYLLYGKKVIKRFKNDELCNFFIWSRHQVYGADFELKQIDYVDEKITRHIHSVVYVNILKSK